MADNGTTHESFERTESVQGSSNPAFGIVFTVFFALIGLWPLPWGGSPRWWALGVAAVFLLAALVFPKTLAPLNRAWMADLFSNRHTDGAHYESARKRSVKTTP
jgi:hypothetical protein